MKKILFLVFINFSFGQQTKSVDFKSVLGDISIDANEKSISGNVIYQFNVQNAIDTIFMWS